MTQHTEETKPVQMEEIAQQVLTLVAERPAKITSDAELNEATGWLARVRTRRKEMEAFLTKLIKPFREAIKNHNTECENLLAPLKEHETAINADVTRYRRDLAAKAAEAQRKADLQHEKRVEKAVEKGKDPALVKPPPVVHKPATTVQTEDGKKVTFRKIRKHRIANPELVPKEYWIIDDAKVGKAVRAGIDVPGCDIWEEESSAVRD